MESRKALFAISDQSNHIKRSFSGSCWRPGLEIPWEQVWGRQRASWEVWEEGEVGVVRGVNGPK